MGNGKGNGICYERNEWIVCTNFFLLLEIASFFREHFDWKSYNVKCNQKPYVIQISPLHSHTSFHADASSTSNRILLWRREPIFAYDSDELWRVVCWCCGWLLARQLTSSVRISSILIKHSTQTADSDRKMQIHCCYRAPRANASYFMSFYIGLCVSSVRHAILFLNHSEYLHRNTVKRI